jgi:TorA-specific chaperone
MTQAGMPEEQQNAARAVIYRWLSSLFSREITAQPLALLQGESGKIFFQQLSLQPELAATSLDLQARLQAITSEEQRLHLAADYCGLFVVAGKFCVSPYAGAYLHPLAGGKEPPLFGQTHQQIVASLKVMGFEVDQSFPEPADHIGVLLAYIAELCLHADIGQQQRFLTRYLQPWQAAFGDKIRRYDQGGFYRSLVVFYGHWLRLDQQWLADN